MELTSFVMLVEPPTVACWATQQQHRERTTTIMTTTTTLRASFDNRVDALRSLVGTSHETGSRRVGCRFLLFGNAARNRKHDIQSSLRGHPDTHRLVEVFSYGDPR